MQGDFKAKENPVNYTDPRNYLYSGFNNPSRLLSPQWTALIPCFGRKWAAFE
ncbi:hypothetical protein N752_08790 [Desulforamulus aquiferis]|nr:hypothetical protein N752_08790 [Desulforamulus aquiferis]